MTQKDNIVKIFAPKSLEGCFNSGLQNYFEFVKNPTDHANLFHITDARSNKLETIKKTRENFLNSKLVLWSNNLSNLTSEASLDKLLLFDVLAGPCHENSTFHHVINTISDKKQRTTNIFSKIINNDDINANYEELLLELSKSDVHHSKYKRHVYNICEELIMNAVKHTKLSSVNDRPRIIISTHNEFLEIECIDKLGLFTKEIFFKYISKMKHVGTKELEIDSKEAGAGLGIIKMLHHCHSMAVSVKPNEQTNIKCIIDTSKTLKSPAMSPRIIAYI